MAGDKPVWRYWLNLAEVPLEQAVCLSLNIDPSILTEDSSERYISAESKKTWDWFSAHFIARRDAARTHIKAKSLKARYNQVKRHYLVTLADFRSWGESLPIPFAFPDEFPAAEPAPEPTPPNPPAKNEPSARNENANLRIIAAMLTLLRDKDGGRFPSDAKVIEVLVEKYGAADGISKRNLESVFPAAKRAAGDELKPSTERRK